MGEVISNEREFLKYDRTGEGDEQGSGLSWNLEHNLNNFKIMEAAIS